MNNKMSDLKEKTEKLIEQYQLKPNLINYGQHFLIDRSTIDLFMKTLGLDKEDLVLEIGPGLGYLTEELVKQAKQVTAVEIDLSLQPVLRKLQKKYSNLNLKFNNILKEKKYSYDVVCGALAYNIFEPLLRQIIFEINFSRAIFIVSQRFEKEYQEMNNLTALMVDAFFKVDFIKTLPVEFFFPQPQYPGLLIKLTPVIKKDKYHFLLKEILMQKNRRIRKSLQRALLKWYESKGINKTDAQVKQEISFITQAPETREPIYQTSKKYLQKFIQQLRSLK